LGVGGGGGWAGPPPPPPPGAPMVAPLFYDPVFKGLSKFMSWIFSLNNNYIAFLNFLGQ
jgi:hypothetical protein